MTTRAASPRARSGPARLSVLIAFYNNFYNLARVLTALEQQGHENFAVVNGNGGPRTAVETQIYPYLQKSPLRVAHLWHIDQGFLKIRFLTTTSSALRSITSFLSMEIMGCIRNFCQTLAHIARQKPCWWVAG